MIEVVVIEDHPLMLEAIVTRLEDQSDIAVVGTADHGAELHRLVRETSPDVAELWEALRCGRQSPQVRLCFP